MANYKAVISLGIFLCMYSAAVVDANDDEPSAEHDGADKFIQESKEKWRKLVENENARELFDRFLSNTHEIMQNENNGNIMTGVTREFRTVLTNKTGAQTVALISDGLTKILTDETAARSLEAKLNGVRDLTCSPETALLVKRLSELAQAVLETKYAPDVIRTIGDGAISFMDKKNPRESIIESLINLKSYMTRSAAGDIKNFVS